MAGAEQLVGSAAGQYSASAPPLETEERFWCSVLAMPMGPRR